MNLFLAYFDWMNFVSDLVVSIISGAITLIIALLVPIRIIINYEATKIESNKEEEFEKNLKTKKGITTENDTKSDNDSVRTNKIRKIKSKDLKLENTNKKRGGNEST